MMEPKILLELYVYGTTVIGRIPYISKEIEAERGRGSVFTATNGLRISSSSRPELARGASPGIAEILYINGRETDKDGSAIMRDFSTNEEAVAYATRVKDAVNEFNGREYSSDAYTNMIKVL